MGRLGEVISTDVVDKAHEVTTETRSGFNQVAQLFGLAGDEAPPLDGDTVILVSVDGTGKYAALGTLTWSQGAKPGERILYARNANKQIVSKIEMLNDGSVKATADKMTIETTDMKITGGSFEVQGSVNPAASGPFCAVTVCPFSGAPHVGPKVQGT